MHQMTMSNTSATYSFSKLATTQHPHDENAHPSHVSTASHNSSPTDAQGPPPSPCTPVNHDIHLFPTEPNAQNPFTSLAQWQALGFEDSRARRRRDASYAHTKTRDDGRGGAVSPFTTQGNKTTTQAKEKVAWSGSAVFNACHRALEPGRVVFEAGVDERHRATQLAGFGDTCLPPLRLDGEPTRGGRRSRGGRRGRGEQCQATVAVGGADGVAV
ncbi:hypothetical protein EKO04_010824 [Ascochyta lentis]|uniref:Uncharacterized protein n=1 Tax=Ascochyta lentis TaxID=205686 RepID=A0A8H7IU70_9PLEO|nr:hypothetical protein EKO04_010824 [Ascochyta lentis]